MNLANNRKKPPKADDELVQLATRIPRYMFKEVKTHCVNADESVMEFIYAAIEARLRKVAKKPKEVVA